MQRDNQHLFLVYANASLKDRPEDLYKVLGQAQIGNYSPKVLSEIIGYLVDFHRNLDPDVPNKILRKVRMKNEKDVLDLSPKDERYKYTLMLIAYYSAFGFNQKKSCDDCYPAPSLDRQEILEEALNFTTSHPKCYECDQALFRQILSEIVDGKEYTSICGGAFQNLMLNASSDLRKVMKVAPNNQRTPFKEHLIADFWWVNTKYDEVLFKQGGSFEGTGFNQMILDLAGNSLGDFLLHNDRRKLKICYECKNFYPRGTIREDKHTFCSDKCRLAFHNRRRIASGEASKYKREKRKQGARESYYG